jgi:hypothetical protein
MSRVASTFDNLSPAQLADLYGDTAAQLRGLEARRDLIKAVLLDKAGDLTKITGSIFAVAITTTKRSTLDVAAVREKLGDAWCARNSKITPVTSLRALPIAAPAIPLAA